jgi:tRNA (guanine37-N1)-methyltransferase
MRKLYVVTVHPRFVDAYKTFGVVRAAQEKRVAELHAIDLRDYAVDKHGSVDDSPYGGGDGMVMRPEPLAAAIEALPERPKVLLTSPAGKPWTQAEAVRLSQETGPLLIVAGRFAGVDQRFIDRYVDEEFSAGDFVLAGGELPALMMLDSMLRLLPGVLGHQDSAHMDSFAPGFAGGLEHPLYTRPPEFQGLAVPPVLLSGDHEAIKAWRMAESRRRTEERRPDLYADRNPRSR